MRRILFPILGIFLFFSPALVFAATLTIAPASGTYHVGDSLSIKVLVTSSAPLNAISGTISFPSSLFSIESVSKGSVLNFWVTEPTFSKGAGTVQFEGVSLSGFPSGSGTVVTVGLRALKVGTGTVSFQSGQILANDGQGTDITSGLSGGTFAVEAAPVKVAAPPKETPTPTPTPEPVEEAPQVVQPAPSLQPPSIFSATKFGAPAITGVSQYPSAQVLLTFLALDGSKVFITDTADAAGGFTLPIPHALRSGDYSVTAVLVEADGTNSPPSNTLTIHVDESLTDIPWWTELAAVLLLLAIGYLLWRVFFNKHDTEDVRKVLHKSFDIIREDLADGSSKSELKKDLSDAEKVIEKEIKDIS